MQLQADKCEQLSRLQLRMGQVRGIPLNLCQSRVGLHSTAGKAQSLREEKDIRVARIDFHRMKKLDDREVKLPMAQRDEARSNRRPAVLRIQVESLVVAIGGLLEIVQLQVSMTKLAPRGGLKRWIGGLV